MPRRIPLAAVNASSVGPRRAKRLGFRDAGEEGLRDPRQRVTDRMREQLIGNEKVDYGARPIFE